MFFRLLRTIAPWILLASFGALACDLSSLGLAQTSKPLIVIQSPAPGTEFRQGEDVIVQTTSTDPSGIVRVELAIDGTPVQSVAPRIPQGQVSFTVIQKWQATPGTHTITVRAFNVSGTASDPAPVSISVLASAAPPQPTGAALPTSVVIVPPESANPPTLLPLGPTTTSATATRIPTTRPRPTNTLSAPPGVYVRSIRVDPPSPRRGQQVGFFVTFLNTMPVPQGYQWRVRIFEPDKRNSFGDTAIIHHDIPVGTTELPSVVNWGVFGPTACRTFIARVFWVDPTSKNETEFPKPDGGQPATTFPLECP